MTEENRENREDSPDNRNEALRTRNLAAEATGEEAENMIPEIRRKISDTKKDMPKRSRAGIIFFLILAVFIVASVLRIIQLQMEENEKEAEEAVLTNVQAEQVTKGDISQSSPVSGRLVSSEGDINVIPLVSGEVTEVFVSEGDHVTAGQALFTIDSTQAEIQAEQAEAQVRQAETQVDQAKIQADQVQTQVKQAELSIRSAQDNVDALKTSLDRMQSLYDAGTVSLSDLESVQTQYDNAVSQYDNAVLQHDTALMQYDNAVLQQKTADSALTQAKLSADAASSTLRYYTVTAPASGTAKTVSVTAGGAAAQTSPAVVISDTSSLTLEAEVSEYLINSVTEGQQVEVYIRSLSEDPYTGTVTEIADTPEQGTYTYDVRITLADYENMKAGMLAEVPVITENKTDVVLVPSDAVVTKRGQSYVAVLTEGDIIELRPVTVGIDNGTDAEITSSLREGEMIVVRGQDYVSDGEHVRVVGQQNGPAEQSDAAEQNRS